MERFPVQVEGQWPYLKTLLPADLEQSAWSTRALRRCRQVPDAAALMRLALAYAVSDMSLKDVAAWASVSGVARVSGPGLFYRLRESEQWLAHVLAQSLAEEMPSTHSGLRLVAVDATVINGPGATGTEWRAHVRFDAASGTLRSVELTDAHGGEGLSRHPFAKNEVVLGDRAYATARGVKAVDDLGAFVVVRLNVHTMRLCGMDRQVLALRKEEVHTPTTGAMEIDVFLPVPPEKLNKSHKPWKLSDASAWVKARAIAGRTRGGEVIWVLTTLSAAQATATRVLELYRVRWQIELLFKRLKSLLHLDALPSRKGPTAKSWMLARLLAAALAQRLVRPTGPLSPWGYRIDRTSAAP